MLVRAVSGGLVFLVWPQGDQDYREDDQSVVEPEDHSQGEDFEESKQDVSSGEGSECQSQEGGQTTVENCRADGDQSIDGPLQSGTWRQFTKIFTVLVLPSETR